MSTIIDEPSLPIPPNATVLETNRQIYHDYGQTAINLPSAGNLRVAHGYSGPDAKRVFLWHQGGEITPAPVGFDTYPVGAGDALVYELGDPNIRIKIIWAYVS